MKDVTGIKFKITSGPRGKCFVVYFWKTACIDTWKKATSFELFESGSKFQPGFIVNKVYQDTLEVWTELIFW